MTPWEQEVARRRKLIEQIYREELGRGAVDPDGMRYWLEQAHTLNNNEKLREAIRFAGTPQEAQVPVKTADKPAGPDRRALIEQIYFQELGRNAVDAKGMQHWLGQTQLSDQQLRDTIRFAAGVKSPAVNPDLSKDPTYAAFLRQMEFDETGIQTALERARTAASSNIASQTPMFEQQRTQAAQNVDRNAEARGMFRSGRRLDQRAQARDSIDLNQRRFEENQRESILGAEQGAADQIARLRRQKAEQELAARNRLTQQSVV